jgi:hypothetical protein
MTAATLLSETEAQRKIDRAIVRGRFLLLCPKRVHDQRILSTAILDNQPDLTSQHLEARRESAAARVHRHQVRIAQHDGVARLEQHRVHPPFGPVPAPGHAEGDQQWLALTIRLRAVSQGEAPSSAIRSRTIW